MSISYHGVVGHKVPATLPSVETWSTNMNILRDPPKSIHTRKIDRVGQTSEIVQMQQDGTDRACEAILTYARGVNPMVGVSYSNAGNNGGQRVNQVKTGGIGNAQAFLPYRIIRDGAFRPPAWSARDLTPLSRMPRVWTSSYTKPGFVDYSKRAVCPQTDDKTQGVKNSEQMLKGCVRPTATYKIETPIIEPFEVRYVIQNPLKSQISAHSGLHSNKSVNANIGDPTNQIIHEPLKSEIHMNLGSNEIRQDSDLSHFDTEKYMRDPLHSNVSANKSQKIQITPIEDIFGMNGEAHTKSQFNIDYTAPKKGYEKVEYIHDDLELSRAVPEYDAYTNKGNQTVYKRGEDQVKEREYNMNRPVTQVNTSYGDSRKQVYDIISNRDYNLKPTINAGGYTENIGMPSIVRQQELTEFDTHKSDMRKKIFEMQQGRRSDNGINPYSKYN